MGHLRCSQVIDTTCSKAFEFLLEPSHLPDLLAPHIEVEVGHCAAEMRAGSEYRFNMNRYGMSQPITCRVESVIKDQVLVYRQVEGIYKKWIHTMKFESREGQQCLVTDLVEYELPFGLRV